jgi:outer membrane receptor for ferrienterochelin and colicins
MIGMSIRFMAVALLIMFPLNSSAQSDTPASPVPVGEEMILFQEIPSVYGASKYEQKVTEAPASVSIITASEIRNYGYRTLADVLRSVRSFYVTNDRNYSYVGVRGFGRPGDYNSRILLLVDGHRLNDSVYDQALVGTEGIIDLDIIDRIEIIRGPGSSLYGSNALFAVVNIITRRGRDLKGAEVSGEAGSFSTYQGRLSYGDKFQNGTEAIVSGSRYDSKGDRLYFREYDAPTTNNGVTEHTDYDRYYSIFTKVSIEDLTLTGAYNSRTKGIPTGAFGTDFNDPGNRTTDDHGYLDLRYERSVARRTDLMARFYYDYFNYYANYITSGVLNKDSAYGEGLGGEVKLTSKPSDANRFIAGAEYQGITHQDQKNYDFDPYHLFLDDKRKSAIWAAYIQDEISISRVLSLTAGLRYDDYKTFGGSTNPRLALIYNPLERSTFKLLYGSAFRAPNVFELYYQSTTQISNPDLKPEKIRTYELVYEQYVGDRLRATAAGYYYKIDNLINQTGASPGVTIFENLARVEARGFELEIENKWGSGVDGRISYTGQRTKDLSTGGQITNSPEHLAKLNLIVPMLKDSLSAGIEEQYMSRRRTVAGNYAPGFFITNLTLFSPRVLGRLDLSVSVYNLFDKNYGDPVSADFVQDTIKQDGRSYRVKLTYAF